MAGFRFGIRQALALETHNNLEDVRWGLTALDPVKRRLRYGAFAASDGEQIPYRLWLPRRPKAAILLLHGCCDYSGAFDSVGAKLARSGFAALAYDQRGFGATRARGTWAGEDRLVRDVRDAAAFFRRRIGQDLPLFVLGESMGGAVALHAAARGLEASGLVLVAPGALASSFRRSLYSWILYGARKLVGEAELVVERLDSSDLSATDAIRLLGDPLVMRSITTAMLDGVIALAYSAVETARRVAMPTLTMVGRKDDLLRRECILELHNNLAGPKAWAEIEDGPHLLLHWTRSNEVLRTARRWIERHL
ncbi:MAG TPA: alpha/beta fold hydrolase [Rhizomicrobium sp.]|nr:alpha/beta fold hydrolase [Rhizomicrobium sp.]